MISVNGWLHNDGSKAVVLEIPGKAVRVTEVSGSVKVEYSHLEYFTNQYGEDDYSKVIDEEVVVSSSFWAVVSRETKKLENTIKGK